MHLRWVKKLDHDQEDGASGQLPAIIMVPEIRSGRNEEFMGRIVQPSSRRSFCFAEAPKGTTGPARAFQRLITDASVAEEGRLGNDLPTLRTCLDQFMPAVFADGRILMKLEHSSTEALLPGDICKWGASGEAEYRVRHIDDGHAWLTPLATGDDVIAPTSECQLTQSGRQARMDRTLVFGGQADTGTASTPTFPDGTRWP